MSETTAATKADEIAYVTADIIKSTKQPDGSLIVVGAVTNPKTDLTGQILDPEFVKRALPDWFGARANIREMHQQSAVGKGQALDMTTALPVLTSRIIDAQAVRKVEEGVYSAYSIGVKGPKVIFDAEAPRGRIVDGKIIEVSLVDYPAADVGKLLIAKSADVAGDMIEAAALTDAQLDTVQHDLASDVAASSADAATSGTTADEGKTAPTDPSNAAPGDALRKAVLLYAPGITEEEMNAVLAQFDALAVANRNQRPGGITATETPAGDAGSEGTTSDSGTAGPTDAAASAANVADSDAPTAGAEKADDLSGNTTKLVAADTAAVTPDLMKALSSDEGKAAIAAAFSAVAPDLIKAAVEAAVNPLRETVAKMASGPRPGGPLTGAARTFALEATATKSVDGAAPEDRRLTFLRERARTETDPELKAAALVALHRLEADAAAAA